MHDLRRVFTALRVWQTLSHRLNKSLALPSRGGSPGKAENCFIPGLWCNRSSLRAFGTSRICAKRALPCKGSHLRSLPFILWPFPLAFWFPHPVLVRVTRSECGVTVSPRPLLLGVVSSSPISEFCLWSCRQRSSGLPRGRGRFGVLQTGRESHETENSFAKRLGLSFFLS